tara:strand:- start:11 stop:2380 length:2370 start_codon:yes stop_codon:yes gene_type:complete
MAITSQKLLPSSKSNSSSIVKAKTTKVSASSLTPVGKKFDVMKDKIFEVDKILKGTLAADKKKITDDKKEEEKQRRNKREDKSEEKKKSPEEKKEKGLKLPKIGFLDRIKNFLTTILLGYVVRRLVGNDSVVGGIGKILEGAAAAVEFTADLTIGVLDGLGSFALFVQNKHKQIEEYSKDKFGEDGVKKFSKLSDSLFNLINAFLIVSMVKPGKDKPGKPGKPGSSIKPKKPLVNKPGIKPTGRTGGARLMQRKHGHAAANIYQNAIDNGKSPKAAKAAVDRALKKGQIISKPQSGLMGGTQTKGKIFSRGGNRAAQRMAVKFFGKNATKVVKKTFGRIPIMGPIIVAVSTLLEDNDDDGMPDFNFSKALFTGIGAALGGLLGSFIPIPILGTLIGEGIGLFIGDLMYELVAGGGIEAVGQKLKDALTSAMMIGTAVKDFFVSGFKNFTNQLFEKNPIEIPDGFGRRAAATKLAEMLGMKQFLKDRGYVDAKDQVTKFPNLLNLYNPFAFVPMLASSFLPDVFGPKATPPAPTVSTTEGATQGYTGSGLGSGGPRMGNFDVQKSNDIVSIGKDLIGKGFSVAEHPDFTKTPTASGGSYTPGEGTVSNVHKGRGHYEGRAIDVTDWRGSLEDSKARYRSVLDSIYNDGNMGNKLLIHDSWGIADASGKDGPGAHGHPQHMHIEVRDAGGKIGKGLFANLGGPEFVIDSDSYMAIESTLPGFLKALNNAEGKQAVKVLENYASYEGMGGETIIVNNIQKVSPSKSKSKSGGSNIIMGGSGISQTDITYAMG